MSRSILPSSTFRTSKAQRRSSGRRTSGKRLSGCHEPGQVIELKAGGRPYKVGVACTGAGRYHVRVTGGGAVAFDAELERLDAHLSRLTVNRRATAIHGLGHVVKVDGVTHRVSRDVGGVLRAPAPALVVAVPVAAGAEVPVGGRVLVLESMKMETVVPVPFDARVRELLVSVGSLWGSGTRPPALNWSFRRLARIR